jgi:hypothetical protein
MPNLHLLALVPPKRKKGQQPETPTIPSSLKISKIRPSSGPKGRFVVNQSIARPDQTRERVLVPR